MDTHIPEFQCDDLLDRAEFRNSEREFHLNVNEALKHLKVTTSLNEVLLDQDGQENGNNSYVFLVPASNSSRDLYIELEDLAGNHTVKTIQNVLVTENVFLYTMHKSWAKVIAAVAVLGGGSAAGVVLAKKRKKKLY